MIGGRFVAVELAIYFVKVVISANDTELLLTALKAGALFSEIEGVAAYDILRSESSKAIGFVGSLREMKADFLYEKKYQTPAMSRITRITMNGVWDFRMVFSGEGETI
jgi:hypothetical protein